MQPSVAVKTGPMLDEENSRWQRNLHTVSNMEMSMKSCSPVPDTALTPLYSFADDKIVLSSIKQST